MIMNMNLWHPMQRKERPSEMIVMNLPGEIKYFKGTQGPKGISDPLDVSLITRWETLQEFVPLKKINSRRQTRDFMPIQSKMMTQ